MLWMVFAVSKCKMLFQDWNRSNSDRVLTREQLAEVVTWVVSSHQVTIDRIKSLRARRCDI